MTSRTTPPTESQLARAYDLVTKEMVLLNQLETVLHMSFLRSAKMADQLGEAIDASAENHAPQDLETLRPPLARSLALVNQVHALLTQLDIGLGGALARAARLAAELETALEAGVEAPLQAAVQAAPAPADPRAEHRRAHRSGTLSRITCDPEVEAFVLGIIEHKTYAQVVEAAAQTCPPDRHISASSLHRWWRKRNPAPKARSAATGSYWQIPICPRWRGQIPITAG